MPEPTHLENEDLRVDVAVEPTLRIRVTDKRNGFVWECPGAPFALHYWETSDFVTRHCGVEGDAGWEFRLIPADDTLGVQCAWPPAACGFRARLSLDGPSLDIVFPERRLIENRQFDVRHMGIDVLPGLGSARTGDEGFLLIPHERGALCRFDKTDERETSALVYAGAERRLTAPVFGTGRGAAGFLGIVSQGEFNAELVIAANRGPEHNLNWVHPRLRLRLHSGDALEETDYALHYTFLDGEDASYVGMARTYRHYLTELRHHPCLAERSGLRPLLGYAASAATVHIQLAEKRRTTSMSGDGDLRVHTQFDEVAQIAEGVRKAGINNAVLVLAGWNCEGRDGLYPTRFPIESAVGGADAMSRAVASIRSAGLQSGALDNYTDVYRRSPAFNEGFSAKQLGGEPWRGGVWAGGQSYVVCPQQAIERYVQRDMRRLRDLGLEGMVLLDHCPGPGVLRCYDEEHPLTRAEYAAHLCDIIKMAQGTFGLCRVSGHCVFAALEADTCMFPVHDTPPVDSLEGEWFVDEVVPFLPIVLHGVVLLAGEVDADPLRLVEYGAAPVHSTTMGEFGNLVEKMAGFYQRYVREIAPLAEQFIESHETPAEGLVEVGYSGGAKVLINRTDGPAEIDGVEIAPHDFRVVGAPAETQDLQSTGDEASEDP